MRISAAEYCALERYVRTEASQLAEQKRIAATDAGGLAPDEDVSAFFSRWCDED